MLIKHCFKLLLDVTTVKLMLDDVHGYKLNTIAKNISPIFGVIKDTSTVKNPH